MKALGASLKALGANLKASGAKLKALEGNLGAREPNWKPWEPSRRFWELNWRFSFFRKNLAFPLFNHMNGRKAIQFSFLRSKYFSNIFYQINPWRDS